MQHLLSQAVHADLSAQLVHLLPSVTSLHVGVWLSDAACEYYLCTGLIAQQLLNFLLFCQPLFNQSVNLAPAP